MILRLRIDLGNDAMQTGTDVAAALRKIAARIDDEIDGEDMPVTLSQTILDLNGNRVGQWNVREAE